MTVNRRGRRILAVVLCVAGVATAAGFAGPPAGASTPTTTVAPTTVAPTTAAPLPSLPEPESEDADPVRNLLPSIVAVAALPETPQDSQAVINAALTEQRHDVAVEERPATLCAVVPVLAPVTAAGRWERDGKQVASSPERRRDPPGYGECLPTEEGGDPVSEGVYQYIAVGPTGAQSSAATLVVGTVSTDIRLLNNGDESVCLLLISPREADFYDAFDVETPLLPGEGTSVVAADTELDIRVFGCTDAGSVGDSLRSFRLTPGERVYVPLFADDEPEGSNPPDTGPTTTTA